MWFSIILATILIQIPNLLAISYFNNNPAFYTSLKIAFFCIPTSFLSTACYSYYYGIGYSNLSYPSLSVAAYGISLLSSITIQFILLRNKTFHFVDILSIILVLLGLLVFIFRDEIITHYFQVLFLLNFFLHLIALN